MSQVFRRIALKLHGLERADREWLVANLPRDTQEQVERSLADLEAMGVPRDASWREALDFPSPSQSRATAEEVHPDLAVLERLDVQDVITMLESEPDWLVACLLAAKDWLWSRDFLAALDPERAQRLCQLARNAEMRLGPSLRDSLLALLAARVRPIEPEPVVEDVNRFDRILEEMENNVTDAAPSSETIT